MNFMKSFFFGGQQPANVATSIGLLIGRLGFGLMLAFNHGLGKLPPSEQLIGGVGSLGFPAPIMFAWAAALAEFIGSLLVAIGLMTRPAALTVAFTMTVAAFLMHRGDPLATKEMALLYLFFGLIYLFTGAGRYSVDWAIVRNCKR